MDFLLTLRSYLWNTPGFIPQVFIVSESTRCFTHRKSESKMIRFKAIETKSVSDADCMKLLTPGRPLVLMERFRDVACQYTKETINKVTFLFLKTIEFYFSVKSCVKKKQILRSLKISKSTDIND
jgi:hypothetical protein